MRLSLLVDFFWLHPWSLPATWQHQWVVDRAVDRACDAVETIDMGEDLCLLESFMMKLCRSIVGEVTFLREKLLWSCTTLEPGIIFKDEDDIVDSH